MVRYAIRPWLAAGVAVVMLVLGCQPASADPPTNPMGDTATGDPAAVAAWPPELQAIIAGTDGFKKGDWYTKAECSGGGADLGRYINEFQRQERRMLIQLAKEKVLRDGGNLNDAAPGGNRPGVKTIGEQLETTDVFPNGNPAFNFGASYCTTEIVKWARPDPNSVFGFAFAKRPDDASLVEMRKVGAQGHGSWVDPTKVCDNTSSLFCSKAYFFDCAKAASGNSHDKCIRWNKVVQGLLNGLENWIESNKTFANRVQEFFTETVPAAAVQYALGISRGMSWLLSVPGKAIAWAAEKGMQQVVKFFVSGAVYLWGQFTIWMLHFTDTNVGLGSFTQLYNIVAGIALMLSFLLWLAALCVAWYRNRFTGAVLGAVKAVVAIQLVPIGVYLMNMLARQCTEGVINAFSDQISSSDFSTSLVAANPIVALLAAFFGLIGLLATFAMLLFQMPMVYAYTLFGSLAAAGQSLKETSAWLHKWAIKVVALCWTPFFMVTGSLLAQALLSPLAANASQNVGQQLATVLAGVLLMVMLPTTPWLLSALMSFTVGHVSAAADAIGQKAARSGAGWGGELAAKGGGRAAQLAGGAAMGTLGAVAALGSNLRMLGEMAGGAGGGGAVGAGASSSSAGGGDGSGSSGGSGLGGVGLTNFHGRGENRSEDGAGGPAVGKPDNSPGKSTVGEGPGKNASGERSGRPGESTGWRGASANDPARPLGGAAVSPGPRDSAPAAGGQLGGGGSRMDGQTPVAAGAPVPVGADGEQQDQGQAAGDVTGSDPVRAAALDAVRAGSAPSGWGVSGGSGGTGGGHAVDPDPLVSGGVSLTGGAAAPRIPPGSAVVTTSSGRPVVWPVQAGGQDWSSPAAVGSSSTPPLSTSPSTSPAWPLDRSALSLHPQSPRSDRGQS